METTLDIVNVYLVKNLNLVEISLLTKRIIDIRFNFLKNARQIY